MMQVLFTCTFLFFFSLIVAFIWRKIVLIKASVPARFESRSPAQQSTVLSTHPVIMTIIFHGSLQSSTLDSAILCNACLQSLGLGQIKTKKTRFERDLFLIWSLWHYTIFFFTNFDKKWSHFCFWLMFWCH